MLFALIAHVTGVPVEELLVPLASAASILAPATRHLWGRIDRPRLGRPPRPGRRTARRGADQADLAGQCGRCQIEAASGLIDESPPATVP
jgi:hypothetical protein